MKQVIYHFTAALFPGVSSEENFMSDPSQNFGAFIKQKRLEKDMAQKQLAFSAGCSVNTIRAIEQNRSNYTPSAQMLASLAKALEVEEEELTKFFSQGNEAFESADALDQKFPKIHKPQVRLTLVFLLLVVTIVSQSYMIKKFALPAVSSSPGGWIGHNYLCGGKTYSERVHLELKETNYLVATKIDGDPCIGSGEISWEGKFVPPELYPYTFQVKLWIRESWSEKTTIDCTAIMKSSNQIEIQNGSSVISFTNEAVAPAAPIDNDTNVIVVEPAVTPEWVTNEPACNETWNGWLRYETSEGDTNYLAINLQTGGPLVNTAIWKPELPVAGKWRVEVFNPVHQIYPWPCISYALSTDTSFATYRIFSASGEKQVSVDQQLRGNTWIDLGVYDFDAGLFGYASLNNITGEKQGQKYVIFSKIRFTYIEP